jgi:hypothetical protein
MMDRSPKGFGFAEEPAGTVQRGIVEFLALARFLLAETPQRAERLTPDIPELRAMVERGYGVVRWHDPDEPMYISVRDGVRTTSASLPEWADPSDVVDVAAPSPLGRGLSERLRDLAQQIRHRDPERHRMYRMAETVGTVEDLLEDSNVPDLVAAGEMTAQENLLYVRSQTPFDEGAFKRIAERAHKAYDELSFSGNGARKVFALYALMAVGGPWAAQALVIARQQLNLALDQAQLPEGPLVASVLDISLWMQALDAATEGGAWIPAASAGRICLSLADKYRDSARAEPTFEQFHRVLYLALAHYRAADLLFGMVEQAGLKQVRRPVLEEAIDRQRSCEEMRARIEASIGWAADVNPMGYNLTHPQRLERWTLSLLRSDPGQARARIYDLSSQLAFPDLVRDIALAVLDLAQERPERAVSRAADVVARMEASLALVAEWGLGYFAYAAELARAGLRRLGRNDEAQYYDLRLSSTWLRDQFCRPEERHRDEELLNSGLGPRCVTSIDASCQAG